MKDKFQFISQNSFYVPTVPPNSARSNPYGLVGIFILYFRQYSKNSKPSAFEYGAEFGWGKGVVLFEEFGEIGRIVKVQRLDDFIDAHVGGKIFVSKI